MAGVHTIQVQEPMAFLGSELTYMSLLMHAYILVRSLHNCAELYTLSREVIFPRRDV